MVHPFKRAVRLEDQILREVSDIILRRVQDPRLAGLTITRVKLTDDLKRGVVFYSLLKGDSASVGEAARGLESASGFIRRELSHRIRIRVFPHLAFEFDRPFQGVSPGGEVDEH